MAEKKNGTGKPEPGLKKPNGKAIKKPKPLRELDGKAVGSARVKKPKPIITNANAKRMEAAIRRYLPNFSRDSLQGKSRIFKTPEDLIDMFVKYVEHVNNNPLYKYEAIKSGDNCGKLVSLPLQRVYTWEGFSVYCAIALITIRKHKQEVLEKISIPDNKNVTENDFGYLSAYSIIENVIRCQNFEGAAAGIFNPQLIALHLNMKNDASVTINTDSHNNNTNLTIQVVDTTFNVATSEDEVKE